MAHSHTHTLSLTHIHIHTHTHNTLTQRSFAAVTFLLMLSSSPSTPPTPTGTPKFSLCGRTDTAWIFPCNTGWQRHRAIVEEIYIQNNLTHGRSRARILQVAEFFRATGISGGVGYANDATTPESTYEPCYDYHNNNCNNSIAESEAKTKVKKLNLRKKYNWI